MALTRVQGGVIDSLPDNSVISTTIANSTFATVSNTFGVTANANTFSNSIIIVSGNTAPINVGMLVTGSNIAPGTTVLSFNTPTTGRSNIRLSQAASGSNTNTAVSFYEANKVLSPGIAAPGMAKAWVNFNGTGTVAIRSSFNVSSITDVTVGEYTVNFTNSMPDANYSFQVCGQSPNTNFQSGFFPTAVPASTASGFRFMVGAGTSAIDCAIITVAIFR